jgi:DNA adenine methylase
VKTLTAFVPWFGAKRLTAPQIVRHFRPHTTYYDLFAGSLAVLFAKERARLEVASELNPDVVNLLRCLSSVHSAKELHELAAFHPVSEERFDRAAERLSQTHDERFNFTRAWDFLLVSWQGPSGLAGTKAKPRFAKRNTASGGSLSARWASVAEAIPAWHERIRQVEFRHASAFDLVEEIPDRDDITIYADPPYYPTTRRGGQYAFDFEIADHVRLAELLNRFERTNIVVSHYACPELDELYRGWARHTIDAPRKLNNVSGGETDAVEAGEVVYVQRASSQSFEVTSGGIINA